MKECKGKPVSYNSITVLKRLNYSIHAYSKKQNTSNLNVNGANIPLPCLIWIALFAYLMMSVPVFPMFIHVSININTNIASSTCCFSD